MSMSIMTPGGEMQVPSGWAGQADDKLSLESTRPPTNRAVTEALQVIDHDIEQLLELRASLTGYGFGKICPVNATDVTQDDGLVCGGFEKNPAVVGSLAYVSAQTEEKMHSVNIEISKDFNDYVPNKVNKYECFYLGGTGSAWANSFTDAYFHGFLIAIARTSMNYLAQIFFDSSSGVYMRVMSGGNWGGWRKL